MTTVSTLLNLKRGMCVPPSYSTDDLLNIDTHAKMTIRLMNGMRMIGSHMIVPLIEARTASIA
jgi:hypothetical protein